MQTRTFQTNMAKLAAAFSVDLTPEKIEPYWEMLSDLTDEQFVIITRRALGEWEKVYALPPIATLRRYAGEVAAQSGAVVDGASAWTYLQQRTIRKFRPGVPVRAEGEDDPYQAKQPPLDWPDELARRIVREELGGIYALAVTEGDYARDQQRKRFVATYDAAHQTAQAEQSVARLAAPDTVPIPIPPRPQRPRLVSGEER